MPHRSDQLRPGVPPIARRLVECGLPRDMWAGPRRVRPRRGDCAQDLRHGVCARVGAAFLRRRLPLNRAVRPSGLRLGLPILHRGLRQHHNDHAPRLGERCLPELIAESPGGEDARPPRPRSHHTPRDPARAASTQADAGGGVGSNGSIPPVGRVLSASCGIRAQLHPSSSCRVSCASPWLR